MTRAEDVPLRIAREALDGVPQPPATPRPTGLTQAQADDLWALVQRLEDEASDPSKGSSGTYFAIRDWIADHTAV